MKNKLFYINDVFFKNHHDPKIKQNQFGKRPYICAFIDSTIQDIGWMIPLTTNIQKLLNKNLINLKPDFFQFYKNINMIGEVANIFPCHIKYLKDFDLFKYKLEKDEIDLTLQKAKHIITLSKNNKISYVDIAKLYNELKNL